MRKRLLTIICAALAFFAGAAYIYPAQQVNAQEVPAGTVPGELIVIFEPGQRDPAEETKQLLEGEASVQEARPLADAAAGEGGAVLVRMEDAKDLTEARKTLEQQPEIAIVQPNFRYRMMEGEAEGVGDTYRDQQYYLGPWDPAFASSCGANVTGAWELMGGIADRSADVSGSGSAKDPVTIAVIDSGCQLTHEDLRDAVDADHAYNAVTKEVGADKVKDESSHGTHVCGIAAGTAGNGAGIAGASGNYARILPINVFVGKWADTADMVTAFSYLEQLMDSGELEELHVINMSLGGYGETDENDVALEKYIERMREKDVLTVCAGGNGDEQYGMAYKDNPAYPGDFEPCLCVTSLDSNGMNSMFSDYNMAKDISAPGSGIISTMTDEKGSIGDGPDGKYGFLDGTSMASPLVAGIAALLWADNPQLTADQVFESITKTAHAVNPVGSHEGETGSAGAIDAAAAMNYARDHYDTVRQSIREADTALEQTEYIYDGAEHRPQVTVRLGEEQLTEGEDYILSYWNCTETGTASVTVTGIGSFIGSAVYDYEILPASLEEAEVSMDPPAFAYDGAYHFPRLTLTLDGKTLKWGRDFAVTADSDGTSEGLHELRLDGRGNYSGTKTVSYRIGEEPQPVPQVKKGDTCMAGGSQYVVTKTAAKTGTVTLKKAKNAKSVTVPAAVKLADGRSYQVTGIGPKAFARSKAVKVIVKTRLLTKPGVKNSLKGSKVKTILVRAGSKKVNQSCVKKYRKIFTKKNAGRKPIVK